MQSITLDAIDLQLLDLLQHDAAKATRPWPNGCMCRPHLPAAREAAARCGPDRAAGGPAAARPAGRRAGPRAGLPCGSEPGPPERRGAGRLEARAVADAEVQQCWRVSPGPDFVLVVHTRDMPGYLALSQRLFTADANVRNVKAFFSTKRAKFETKCLWRLAAKRQKLSFQ